MECRKIALLRCAGRSPWRPGAVFASPPPDGASGFESTSAPTPLARQEPLPWGAAARNPAMAAPGDRTSFHTAYEVRRTGTMCQTPAPRPSCFTGLTTHECPSPRFASCPGASLADGTSGLPAQRLPLTRTHKSFCVRRDTSRVINCTTLCNSEAFPCDSWHSPAAGTFLATPTSS